MSGSLFAALCDRSTLYASFHGRTSPLETPRDASRLRCVAPAQIMRREMSRINDLHRTHRAPANDERRRTQKSRQTPDSGGAHLSFVRPLHRRQSRNLITMNCLPLCLHNARFFGLLRHPCLGNPHSFSHNPASDARIHFVRHLRPLLTNNPPTISSLSLCSKKSEISGSLRHPSVRHPRSPPAFPTTHNPQPTPRPRPVPLTLGGSSYIYIDRYTFCYETIIRSRNVSAAQAALVPRAPVAGRTGTARLRDHAGGSRPHGRLGALVARDSVRHAQAAHRRRPHRRVRHPSGAGDG
jgi:hypothetical protein